MQSIEEDKKCEGAFVMKEKLLRYFLLLFLASILTLSACSFQWSQFTFQQPVAASFWDLQVQTWNKRISSKELTLTDYGKRLGIEVISPKFERFAANLSFQVSGKIEKWQSLQTKFIKLEVVALEPKTNKLPNAFTYFVPIQGGRFTQEITLFARDGLYQVKIMAPEQHSAEYLPVTTFQVMNLNPELALDIQYSQEAIQRDWKLTNPHGGYITANGFFELNGSGTTEKVHIRIRKGEQTWEREIQTPQGQLQEEFPLPYGVGLYEVQIWIPSKENPEQKVIGATLYVNNQLAKSASKIQYTDLYEQRGLKLFLPEEEYLQAKFVHSIRGEIDPKAPMAKQTEYVVIQIMKGKDKATYFVPVEEGFFNWRVGLRFGAGMYQVTLLVPEVNQTKTTTFRFYPVARWKVWSDADRDLRDLMPSRGIQSADPEIRQFAKQITRGKKNDYEKVKAIYEFVAKHIEYDLEKLKNNDYEWTDGALKTLTTRKGVCQDFSFLTLALLRSIDLPARFIEGEAGGQQHAWVEAWVDGRWISMDPTWGAGVLEDGRFIKKYEEKYFDPSPELFNKTHTRKGVVY